MSRNSSLVALALILFFIVSCSTMTAKTPALPPGVNSAVVVFHNTTLSDDYIAAKISDYLRTPANIHVEYAGSEEEIATLLSVGESGTYFALISIFSANAPCLRKFIVCQRTFDGEYILIKK